MAISITNKNYATRNHPTGNGFLLANAGQSITDFIEIVLDFGFTGSVTNQVLIVGENQLQLLSGTWETLGIVVGDVHVFSGTVADGTNTYTFGATSYSVGSVSGNIITYSTSPFPVWSVSQVMPSLTSTGLSFTSDRLEPETIEIFHNLIENSASGGDPSLFDGEVNRFKRIGADTMAVNEELEMLQLGNKSGGSYSGVILKRIADVGSKVAYRITFYYDIALDFEDSDFNEPIWFNASESLKPYYRIKALPQDNNPNSALQLTYSDYLGNVGWYDENYNQGINPFTIEYVMIGNTDMVLMPNIAYNRASLVDVKISHTLDFAELAELSFSLIPDIADVKNKPQRHSELTSLAKSFIETGPSIVRDSYGISNRKMTFSSESIDISVANETRIQFILTPTAEFTAYMESLPEESRRYRLVVNVESEDGTENENNAVSLILSQGLLLKSKKQGGRYFDVTSRGFYNHKNEITGVSDTVYSGCAEDDFVYVTRFLLPKDESWKSLRTSIRVVNILTGESFDLISKLIPFTGYVTNIDGIIQINYTETIQQLLEAPERNKISLKLTGNDTSTHYEVELIWSLLASWRYWLPQNNALVDFFNPLLPNNGLNQNWVRYAETAGFQIMLTNTLTDPDDVEFYWSGLINLQDYDDSAEITSAIEYYDVLDNLQTSLLAGQNMRIKAIHTLSSGSWSVGDVWGWISQRPKENESNKRISTFWDWTSQSSPLKPLAGETKAKLTFPASNVAVVECLVDTSMINVNDVTFISRIETPADPVCTTPIDWVFNEMIANSKTEADLTSILTEILQGTAVTGENVCCPTCEVTIGSATAEVYAFGNETEVQSLVATFTGDPCCFDKYKVFASCEVNFVTIFDAFCDEITGDIDALKDLVPSQINSFFGNDLQKIVDRILAITTDETIRYDIMLLLLTNGLRVICTGGVKLISGL